MHHCVPVDVRKFSVCNLKVIPLLNLINYVLNQPKVLGPDPAAPTHMAVEHASFLVESTQHLG